MQPLNDTYISQKHRLHAPVKCQVNPGTLPLSSVRSSEELIPRIIVHVLCVQVRSDWGIFQLLVRIRRFRRVGSSVGIPLPEELSEFFHQDIPETLFLVHAYMVLDSTWYFMA